MAVLQVIKQELAPKRGQAPPPDRKTLVRGDLAFAFNPLPGAPSLHMAIAAPVTDKTPIGPSKYHEVILTAQEVCQLLAYVAKVSEKHKDIMLTLPKPGDLDKTEGNA